MHGRHVTAGDRDEAREPGLGGQKIVPALVERSVGHPVADGEELPGPVEQELEVHSVEEIAGAALDLLETFQQALGGSRRALERLEDRRGAAPVDDVVRLAWRWSCPRGELARRLARELGQIAEQGRSVEQSREGARTLAVGRQGAAEVVEPLDPRRERVEVAAMGRDRRLRDLRPHDRFGSRVGGERLCPVAEPANRGGDLAKSIRPGGGRGRLLGQRAAQLVDRRARLGGQRVAQQQERRIDSALDLDADDRAAGTLVCRDGEDAQMPGEIATVDGGDVSRLQRLARARVVPVVEVPAVTLEIGHGRQGCLEPIHRVERADPAEIARGHGREQVDAHVGRRRPVRDDGPRVVLEVIGRERIVFLRHERLEEAPALPRRRQDALPLVAAQLLGRPRRRGTADPASHRGREKPEDGERRGDGPDLAGRENGDDPCDERQDEGAPHLQVGAAQIEGQARLHLRG